MYSSAFSTVRSDFCNPIFSVWIWTSSCYLNSECYCLSWPALISWAEISHICRNTPDNLLDSEQILILQNLFLCLFSLHNLFSSPTATESCYSGVCMAKERNGRWGCSIFNAFREKNTRACRAHVWSNSSLSRQTLRNVPQEWESQRQNSSNHTALVQESFCSHMNLWSTQSDIL